MAQDGLHNHLAESIKLFGAAELDWIKRSPADAEHALLAELGNLSPSRMCVPCDCPSNLEGMRIKQQGFMSFRHNYKRQQFGSDLCRVRA